MKADAKSLEELIQKQPPPSSEKFWQQVEKAKASSPNSALLAKNPQKIDFRYKKTSDLTCK
jgi:hypothetical protein